SWPPPSRRTRSWAGKGRAMGTHGSHACSWPRRGPTGAYVLRDVGVLTRTLRGRSRFSCGTLLAVPPASVRSRDRAGGRAEDAMDASAIVAGGFESVTSYLA